MSILDSNGEPMEVPTTSVDMDALLSSYEIVDVNQENGTIVLADRETEEALPPSPIDAQLAQSPPSSYLRHDYNPELTGTNGVRKYMEMKNDSTIRTSLRIMKTPIIAARWFIEPASDSDEDEGIAQFVWDLLNKHMEISWQDFLLESLLMLDYGYYMFEPVYDLRVINNEPRIVWKKFVPLHPIDVHQIEYDELGDGKFTGVRFGRNSVFIEPSKLLVFSFDSEGGNIEGRSVLRSAYKHWYFKENLYKIDAIQKERHGVGVPIIKLPRGFDRDRDIRLAQQIGENLRSNEKAHVIVPPGWEIEFAELRGQNVDALQSAEHHGEMIYENVLAAFMTTQRETSQDVVEEQSKMFQRATRFIADVIADVMNKYAIPRIVKWNFGTDNYPALRVRRLGDTTDWRTISFAMRNFAGMGALIPDERLEGWVRDELDLPNRETETAREVSSPQQANVGSPNQSTAPSQGTGSGPEGSDASGEGE